MRTLFISESLILGPEFCTHTTIAANARDFFGFGLYFQSQHKTSVSANAEKMLK